LARYGKDDFDPAAHRKPLDNFAKKRPTAPWLQDGNGKPGEASAAGLLCRLCNEQPELQFHKGFQTTAPTFNDQFRLINLPSSAGSGTEKKSCPFSSQNRSNGLPLPSR